MKKLLFSLFSVITSVSFFLCCSTDDYFQDFKSTKKINFPVEVEEYGEALAKEFRQTICNLNDMGKNYLDADDSPEFEERFYNDWQKASPMMAKHGMSVTDLHIPSQMIIDGFLNLTEIQLKFMSQIVEKVQKSSSSQDLLNNLININKDIYEQVPEIEQERLFYTTATLYYLINEIENLENQGQMLITRYNNIQFIKTRSESDSGSVWGSCRQFLSVIAINVGTILSKKEIVTALSWSASASAFVITACFLKGDSAMCDDFAERCVTKQWKYEGGAWIRMDCTTCYKYCMQNGSWNFNGCPL